MDEDPLAIPDFLRISQEDRTLAWRDYKVSKPVDEQKEYWDRPRGWREDPEYLRMRGERDAKKIQERNERFAQLRAQHEKLPKPPTSPDKFTKYRAGSRKQQIWEIYNSYGYERALEAGLDLGLSENTIKSWSSAWRRNRTC